MDLKKIRARIKDGSIGTIDEFERDIRLMFANAAVYNPKGSQVAEFAREMLVAAEGHIAHWKSMEHHLKR
jgi:bromodomain-containing protein 8